ncbi:hypothetical protein [Fimbriiglobus ruber]|uniref:Uncharacterized protein n=1 Tax=Fimbriiglobus ruber TaxID=1908690 RepID=A0A225DLZ4_9BACT|nr:hypothetical protein [Fimbriiglobus ruber]OWK42490.1 hypothetical protein FRUB_04568 [Fimbriiglobus ruber]
MTDPLVEMMRDVTWRPESALEHEADELCEQAYFALPWIGRLTEEQQDLILLFAFCYAEQRLKRILT